MLPTAKHSIEGVRCEVYDSDPGRPEAAVFVHGNPGPMDDWEGVIPSIGRYGRVVAMDMPGYGRADRPRRFDYTIAGYARYLGALLDRLRVERAHLVLHDFGGPWGIRWALGHKDRLASLTLVNCGILEGYRWHGFARVWQTPVLGELAQLTATPWGVRAGLNRRNPKPLPRAFTDRIAKYADWGHKRAVLKLYRASKDLAGAFLEFAGKPFSDKLPACVIWGEADPFVGVEYARKQAAYFPRAEIHVLPGLGHWPFIDDPEAVRQPLKAFLKRQLRKRPNPPPVA